jgi:hypothetical protein
MSSLRSLGLEAFHIPILILAKKGRKKTKEGGIFSLEMIQFCVARCVQAIFYVGITTETKPSLLLTSKFTTKWFQLRCRSLPLCHT